MSTTALATLTNKLAAKFDMGGENGGELINVLKATAFKGPATDAQLTALMIVANQYGLNPWTREIYAFPDKNNGIVPVVGVDGWSRIINENDKFDGMEFVQDDESCTCRMYRKDRSHPVSVTEYLSECRRQTQPWGSHPRRMLRHKAMIQCARLAFGYVGIYDQDEAERIAEIEINPLRPNGAQVAAAAAQVTTSEERLEYRARIIADLELVATEQGRAAFRDSWKNLSQDDQALVGIPERNRIDALGSTVIEGEPS